MATLMQTRISSRHKSAINPLDIVIGSYAAPVVQLAAQAIADDHFDIGDGNVRQRNGFNLGECRQLGSETYPI